MDIWLLLRKSIRPFWEGLPKKRVAAVTIHSYLSILVSLRHVDTKRETHTHEWMDWTTGCSIHWTRGSGVSQNRPSQWEGRKKRHAAASTVVFIQISVLRHFSPTAWRGAVPLRERTTCCWTKRSYVALDVEPSCFPTTISRIWVVKVITQRAWGLPSEQ